jgi:hypothetical protein
MRSGAPTISRLAAPGPEMTISSPLIPVIVPATPFVLKTTSMYGRAVSVLTDTTAPLNGDASIAVGTGVGCCVGFEIGGTKT